MYTLSYTVFNKTYLTSCCFGSYNLFSYVIFILFFISIHTHPRRHSFYVVVYPFSSFKLLETP